MAVPGPNVLVRAAQLATETDKPIYLDYFNTPKKAFFGVCGGKPSLLMKSSSEFTSLITSYAKFEDCIIVTTENSIYIVPANTTGREISESQLQALRDKEE